MDIQTIAKLILFGTASAATIGILVLGYRAKRLHDQQSKGRVKHGIALQ